MGAVKLVALFVAMAVGAVIVRATEFKVGDDKGWNLGVNYTEWALDKDFKVGDKLVFNYPVGKHNVLKVGSHDFSTCNKTSNTAPLATGNDVIDLTTAGLKLYICAVGDHCTKGMKLVIYVDSAEAPAPAPPPTGGKSNGANVIASFASTCLVGLAATAATAVLML